MLHIFLIKPAVIEICKPVFPDYENNIIIHARRVTESLGTSPLINVIYSFILYNTG